MKILIVEDKSEEIKAARTMLKEHDVTVVSGFDQAQEILKSGIDKEKAEEEIGCALPMGTCFSSISNWNGVQVNLKDGMGNSVSLEDLPQERQERVLRAAEKCVNIKFDVVMLDVEIPKGGDRCMAPDVRHEIRQQGARAYGPVILLHAVQAGVRKIAVLTRGNHHEDPFVFAFDELSGFEVGDLKVVCSNQDTATFDLVNWAVMDDVDWDDKEAYAEQERREEAGEVVTVKNWATLLKRLTD